MATRGPQNGRRGLESGGGEMKKKKKIMAEIVATNVVAS